VSRQNRFLGEKYFEKRLIVKEVITVGIYSLKGATVGCDNYI
jgi:hypothetical protein